MRTGPVMLLVAILAGAAFLPGQPAGRTSSAVAEGAGLPRAAPLVRAPATATATARRLHRRIPHPADAICVDPALADRDPVMVLQDLMAGRYGPLGYYGSSDIGGVTNIGGPRQWIFTLGDTLLGPNDGVTMPGGMTWTHNSFLIQDDNCFWVEWGGKAAGAPRSLIEAPAGSWYWPGDAYVHGDKLYQFVAEVRATGGGGLFDFDVFDTDLAVIDLGSWNLENATIIEHGPWEGFDPEHLEGIFNVETGSSEVVFGVVAHQDPDVFGMVRLSDPANPLAPWLAWNGSTWGDPATMVPVMPHTTGDNTGVRPFRWNGKWYALGWSWTTTSGIQYFVRRADTMTGPYLELNRVPIRMLPGQPADAIQYWHTLEGGYVLADGVVLMQWANHGDLGAGAALRLVRPAVTRFRLDTLTADPVTR